MPGDYDGDGRSDSAVFRNNVSMILRSLDGAVNSVTFGLTGDKPTPGDYDGDGRTDIAVFRPTEGVWYQIWSSNNSFSGVQWGVRRDVPVPAAYVP